jgi:hypothetical protein
MGTVLVSIVLAQAGLGRQTARAQRRIEACRVADALLREWWPERSGLPRNGGGEVQGAEGWSWRTETAPCEQAETLQAKIVTLEVFRTTTAEADGPSARVQILLPKASHARQEGTDTD